MGYKPIDTKCWIKFLTHQGFKRDRIKGSHYIWKKKGYRPIPVWENEKQIPAMHIKTSSVTLNVTIEYIEDWVKENC